MIGRMHETLASLLDLSGRTAIVTGGAMGIGRAIALRLHEAGADVVVADRAEKETAATAADLDDARPGSALAAVVDVADRDDVEGMVAGALERFGRLDVMVNNAGIFPMISVTEMTERDFAHVLDVNLRGVFLCTQAAARAMIAQGVGGRIVTVTSVDALHPSMVGLAAYDASKHGAWGFLKNAALELAPHGILVNAIAPGGVLTPGVMAMMPAGISPADATPPCPLGRLADPDEIARIAVVLCSDLATYMTGAQVVVDGGLLLG
jgi:2-dehydro-3-deoxy-D-gluconate 5-dehydrogenase